MRSLAANMTTNGQAQPSPKSGKVPRSLSRRVSFNESTIKSCSYSPGSVAESMVGIDIETNRDPIKTAPSQLNICCAWCSLVIGIITVILLVIGGVFFAFFQGNLPEFHVTALNVTNVFVIKNSEMDTLLSADIEMILSANNTNEDMPVFYHALTADLSSGDIALGGGILLPEQSLQPFVAKELKVKASIKDVTVPKSDAKDFKNRATLHELPVALFLGGKIHFVMEGKRMAGFPFIVVCHAYQGDLDDGERPLCVAKMTPLS